MRVLLAEDNVLLRDGLTSLLRGSGHEVDAVANGTDLRAKGDVADRLARAVPLPVWSTPAPAFPAGATSRLTAW